MNKVVVVIDMQNDFVDGSLGTTEAQKIVPHVKTEVEAAQKAGASLVFTMDTHGKNYLETQEGKNLPVEHCIQGTKGWQIIDTLQSYVKSAVAVVEKPTFGSKDLPDLLADYDEIELMGLCTDICVVSNALMLKAFYPEKSVSVVSSCCAGVTPESHEAALKTMQMCQIKIC